MKRELCFFSRADLHKMHKLLAHPTTKKLAALLKRANSSQYTSITKTVLKDIVRRRSSCYTMASKPFVFRVTIPDSIQFKHEIILGLAWIEPQPHHPVLHTVDCGTRFSAARFVDGEYAEPVWNTSFPSGRQSMSVFQML